MENPIDPNLNKMYQEKHVFWIFARSFWVIRAAARPFSQSINTHKKGFLWGLRMIRTSEDLPNQLTQLKWE
jgi:hypothetical protein